MSIVDLKPSPTTTAATRKKRRWVIPGAIALSAFFLILSPFWAPLLFRRLAFFRVRHVEVVGAQYVQPRDVVQRLRIDTLSSVWDNPGPLEARLAQHPLVKSVHIDRRLPGTLVVRLVEHVPVALVPTGNGFRAYDERAVQLPIDPTAADVDAPILAAPDAPLLRLLGSLRAHAPALYARVSEVRREGDSGAREFLFVLDSVPVRTLADVTLNRLADLDVVEQDLARRQMRAVELDLRYRDQVIARLP